MNFANQLKESAKKAASAAKNFKGFDQMADSDEYIHSEGLNVKKQQQQPERSQQNSQPQPTRVERSSQKSSKVAVAGLETSNDNDASDSAKSVEPTWSLLDRPTTTTSTTTMSPPQVRPSSRNASTISSASPASSISPPHRRPPPPRLNAKPDYSLATQRSQSTASVTAMPLLSVVADALEGSSSVSNSGRGCQGRLLHDRSYTSGYDTDNEESSVNPQVSSCSSSNSSSSSDESDNDSSSDDEDPILSQIRRGKQQPASSSKRNKHKEHSKKKKKSTRHSHHHQHHQQQPKKKQGKQQKKKNPHRFMEELDQRNSRGPLVSQTESSRPHGLEIEMDNSDHIGNEDPTNNNPLYSLRTWMTSSLQRNATANSVAAKASSLLKLGPLSRRDNPQTNKTTASTQNNDEEFHVLVSSSVLGDDELAALAQMKDAENRSILGSLIKIAMAARNHPREAFILFTLVLGFYVFFVYREKANEDDVQ